MEGSPPVIDLDQMEDQLVRATTKARKRAPQPPASVPAPTPAPARAPRRVARSAAAAVPPRSVPAMLELGLIDEVEARIAATTDRLDALTWTTMRALLTGQRDTVAAGLEKLGELSRSTQSVEAWNRYWIQRLWAAFEWGGDQERHELLDHCRERAYRFDDLEWWGNLALLLAATGRREEAVSAFDEAQEFLARAAKDGVWLDTLTNLLDAAALLGDSGRVIAAQRALRWPEGRLVVVGHGVMCKGSVDRYQALGYAAQGKWQQADECFRSAASAHRAIGAGPLLRRTREQAERISPAA